MAHISVLLHEIVEGLALQKGYTVVDCTLGSGGHSKAICEALSGDVTIIGIDRDMHALERAEAVFATGTTCPHHFVLRAFRDLDHVLDELSITHVDALFFDLGLSSPQLDDSGRGFTFRKDEPLVMTMEHTPTGVTAYEVVNEWSEESLFEIIRGFGEEQHAGRIARAIVQSRLEHPIETSGALASIVYDAVPAGYRHRRIHPATKTFQAIRMAVNDELGNLELGLRKAFTYLKSHGRMAVISFHSLEDRMVKQFMREQSDAGTAVRITKKPIIPNAEEVTANPRSRSAKLRIIEKI